MAGNKRTYWAIEGMGCAPHGTGHLTNALESYEFVPGVQSLGITTNFNLEQIFQLGQLEIYQDLEEVPDIEMTVERVIDQHALLYCRGMDVNAPTATTITDDQNNQVDIAFVVGGDDQDGIGEANPTVWAYNSGMFVSSASFNFGTDGFFTESISLVGNHQKWTSAPGFNLLGAPTEAAVGRDIDAGNVAKRQKFAMINTPAPVSALTSAKDNGANEMAISSISLSVDFGREAMNILGKRQPYHRYVTFPVEVTCDIEAYVTDTVDMTVNADPEVDNLTQQAIKFVVHSAKVEHIEDAGGAAVLHTFELGATNKLQSVTWNGMDTGGTNATVTYSYRNFNRMDVNTVADLNGVGA